MAWTGERGIQKTLVAQPFQAAMFGNLFVMQRQDDRFA